MERKKMTGLLGIFFLFMAGFTVLSHAADSFGIARVSVKTMENQVITHQVKGTGKTEGLKEEAIFVEEEQKVEKVWVREGQKVTKGELLIQLDLNTLEETISRQEREKKKLQAAIEAAAENAETEKKKQELAYERAQEDYQQAVENGEIDLANAQQEVDLAYEKLNDFYAEEEAALEEQEGQDPQTQEDALLEEIRTKEEAYNQAVEKRNQEVQEAQRAMEDAQLPITRDSTIETSRQDLQQVEEKLEKLQVLKQKKGKITSPAEGVICGLNVKTGGVTALEAAVSLAVSERGVQFIMQIKEEDRKYVEPGQEAVIEADNGEREVTGCKVKQIRENKEDPALFDVYLEVPAKEMEISETGEAVIQKESQAYQTCIPLSALNEEQGRYFVYVAEEEESVMGKEMVVRKVNVTVIEKNESYAALTEGALTSDQKIIVNSNKEIQEGSRVRIQENE